MNNINHIQLKHLFPVLLLVLLCVSGCAPMYYYYTYTIKNDGSSADNQDIEINQILDVIDAAGGTMKRVPAYYTVFNDGCEMRTDSISDNEIAKQYRLMHNKNLDKSEISRQYFQYYGARNVGKSIIVTCDTEISIMLGGRCDYFGADDLFFLEKLEEAMKQAGISYQYNYDYRYGSVFSGGE